MNQHIKYTIMCCAVRTRSHISRANLLTVCHTRPESYLLTELSRPTNHSIQMYSVQLLYTQTRARDEKSKAVL